MVKTDFGKRAITRRFGVLLFQNSKGAWMEQSDMSVNIARRHFTVNEYYRMGAAGVFSEHDRVELIEGEVIEMSPIGSRHAACVGRLTELLGRMAGETT